MNNLKTKEQTIASNQASRALNQASRASNQASSRIHKNVMELLVTQEVKRQREQLPENLAKYIDPVEVATYALNRLPPLYACSQQGWLYQELEGQSKFRHQITTAVRQALAAVQRDPIKRSTPLAPSEETELQRAQAALVALQNLLEQEEVSWQNMANMVQKALTKTATEAIKQVLPKKTQKNPAPQKPQVPTLVVYDWKDNLYR
ncbi:MAG: late competence development ComFB family protein [Symploca sp. SIO2D2]|nr:late competence development ComFB family protein [Symploca sp. SIO2D2]NER46681.1 late competence development ComFB family protein [Symploca sp. SIO1A3]